VVRRPGIGKRLFLGIIPWLLIYWNFWGKNLLKIGGANILLGLEDFWKNLWNKGRKA